VIEGHVEAEKESKAQVALSRNKYVGSKTYLMNGFTVT
jgi:hypothetical protein